MEPNIENGKPPLRHERGFTLLELLIVVSIVGILASVAEPSYQGAVRKAREATLRQDLFILRDVLDQYRADKGQYPKALPELVSGGYLRTMPVDPFTKSSSSWQEIAEPSEGGIWDARSGSDLVGSNGLPYNQW